MRQTDIPDVVFLHGLFGSPHDFDRARALLPREVRTHAPELPIASGPGNATTVAELVGFLDRRLDALSGRPAVLVGNSLGGHVTLAYALEHAERVRALVLSGSSGLFERGLETGVPHRPGRDWLRAKIEEVFHDRAHVTDALVDDVARVVGDKRRALSLVRLARNAKKDNLAPLLPRVTAPALLLWGAEDRITPPEVAHRFRQLLPASRLLFVLDAGHAPMIERPAPFAFHLSAFLADVAPRPWTDTGTDAAAEAA